MLKCKCNKRNCFRVNMTFSATLFIQHWDKFHTTCFIRLFLRLLFYPRKYVRIWSRNAKVTDSQIFIKTKKIVIYSSFFSCSFSCSFFSFLSAVTSFLASSFEHSSNTLPSRVRSDPLMITMPPEIPFSC